MILSQHFYETAERFLTFFKTVPSELKETSLTEWQHAVTKDIAGIVIDRQKASCCGASDLSIMWGLPNIYNLLVQSQRPGMDVFQRMSHPIPKTVTDGLMNHCMPIMLAHRMKTITMMARGIVYYEAPAHEPYKTILEILKSFGFSEIARWHNPIHNFHSVTTLAVHGGSVARWAQQSEQKLWTPPTSKT